MVTAETRRTARGEYFYYIIGKILTDQGEQTMESADYTLKEQKNGEYTVTAGGDMSILRVVIPEEHDGIPITRVEFYAGETWNGTICLSKNVKTIERAYNILSKVCAFGVEIDPQNKWLKTDGKAVFNEDMTRLLMFTALDDESYTVPDGVKIITQSAFAASDKLREIILTEGLEIIEDYAFADSRILKLDMPDSLRKIGGYAFRSCYNMRSMRLSENIEEIEEGAFFAVYLKEPLILHECLNKNKTGCFPSPDIAPSFIIAENSRTFAVVDGVIYTKDMKTLIVIPRSVKGKVVIPEGVETISCGAAFCNNNNNIDEVVLPESLAYIRNVAFQISSLKRINLENVKVIGYGAFSQALSLEMTGNIGAEEIDRRAFYKCTALKKVKLTRAKILKASAFHDCHLKEISLPDGLETIDPYALYCNAKTIHIPKSVSHIKEWFADSEDLEIYDTENSFIYGGKKGNMLHSGMLIKVLSPDTDEIKYAVKLFRAEETEKVKDSVKYICSLFGGEVL